MNSLILRATTKFMFPLLLLFAVFLLLRGHNAPGGGFSGGLVAASAFVIYAFASSVADARAALRVDTHTLIGAGLLMALAAGVPALWNNEPFLTGQWGKVNLPTAGQIDLGTPLLFDIGVFLVVVGVTLMTILPLAEE